MTGLMASYLSMLRPAQWLKNLMLFFPPFLAGHALQEGVFTTGLVPFFSFCLVSSAGYLLNDLLDCERDLLHPYKRLRPLASGLISIPAAAVVSVLLFAMGVALAVVSAPPVFVALLLGYASVSVAYSLYLKQKAIVDLFCIAAGFLIRLQAGGELFAVPISPWLFLSVLLLSLFLSTGKRLAELQALGEGAGNHRVSLAGYPPGFLMGTLYLTAGTVLVTYAMYVVQRPKLIYTVPLCLFGLLRYILRVSSGKGGDPTEALLKDRVLLVVGLAWVLLVFWSIYR
jgi:4-hydroxybenzoate polyprenyltransferase